MSRRKIAVMTCARSDYGLLYWLMREINDDPALQLQLIVTGAHLLAEHGETHRQIEADGFNIDAKVDILSGDDSALAIAKAVSRGVFAFAEVFEQLQPDIVVVLGDRFETLAAAQAAMFLHKPIAHIHGGELTRLAMDDAIRHGISKMAHLHFAAAQPYRQRIIQMGENPEHVFNVGAPGLDHITRSTLLTKQALQAKLKLRYGPINFLITYHPVTLHGDGTGPGLTALLQALSEFPQAGLFFTVPNVDEGSTLIRQALEAFVAEKPQHRFLYTCLGLVNYLSLVKEVDAVVGNSSSGLIEVPYMHTPTINIGDRQQGRLLASSVINCREDKTAILAAIHRALSADFKQSLQEIDWPYGKGNASFKIKEILKSVDLNNLIVKQFYDLEMVDAGLPL